MYKSLFLCVFIASFSPSVRGQKPASEPEHRNQLGVGIGYTQLYAKDLNFSPLNYSGNGLVYDLSYERHSISDNNRFTLSAVFSSDNLKASTNNTIDPLYIYADVGLSYLTRLFPSKQSKTKYYLGVQYNTRVFYMDYDDQEAFSFTATHGLSISGLLEHRFNMKNTLRTSLAIPFLQLLARPPYNGIDEFIIENQDHVAQILFSGKLASFDRYLALYWNTDYSYALTRFLDIGLSYSLGYQKAKEPTDAILWQHQLSTHVSFKF